jgi:carotenoid cleavage dioxygenase-like enzyme
LTNNELRYLSGNFAPIDKTCELTTCHYKGTIPADFAGGQYVRNGGNPITNSELGRDAHWFDGDGMLSGVFFRQVNGEKHEAEADNIRPEFVNQYMITDVFTYAKTSRALRKPVLPSIATLVNPTTSIVTIVYVVLRTIFLVFLSRFPGPQKRVKKISVANTAVIYHDGRALATCESGPPLRFALPGLETIGWFNGRTVENELALDPTSRTAKKSGFGGDGLLSFMKEWTTAHPRVDPITGELIAFHSVFIKPFVYYSIVPPSWNAQSDVPPARFDVPVPGVSSPKMMHDFGVSRGHTVIMDLPLSLDPFNIVKGVPVLSYDTSGRSRFGVFPRYKPREIQWFETNPCCIFHTANCWDTTTLSPDSLGSTESVNLLACRLTSASLVFSAGNLPTPDVDPVPPEYAETEQCRLYYYNFPLSPPGQLAQQNIRHQWALSSISFEFPTLAPNYSMREAQFVYGCSTRSASYTVALGKAAKIDFLAKFNVRALITRGLERPPQSIKGCVDTRTVSEILASSDPHDPIQLFEMPEGWFAQEPRFVPRSNANGEDDGWLLTYVFDEAQLNARGECPDHAVSELWIIDAKGMKDVVARIKLPQRVPYGLHGAWFTQSEVQNQKPYQTIQTIPGPREGGGLWSAFRDVIERRLH